MNYIVKKLSKKAISLICVVAIMLSAITVTFTTMAADNKEVKPYVVKTTSPAIPLTAYSKIDLNNIDVEFTEGLATDGTEIDWSIAPTETSLELVGTELTMFQEGVYEITATKKSDSGVSKKLYAVVKDIDDTEWVLYNVDFTKYDSDYAKLGYVDSSSGDSVTYNGEAISATNAPFVPEGWQSYYTYNDRSNGKVLLAPFAYNAYPYTISNGTAFNADISTGIVPFANPYEFKAITNRYSKDYMTGYFVLNNEIVNDFTDFTLTTQGNYYNYNENGAAFGLAGRIELNADGSLKLDAATSINAFCVDFGMNHTEHIGTGIYNAPQKNGSVTTHVRAESNANTATTAKGILDITSGILTEKTHDWQYLTDKQACSASQCADGIGLGTNATLSVRYSGNKAILSSPEDADNKTFTIDSTPGTGAIAIIQSDLNNSNTLDCDSHTILRSVKVTLNNDPTNPNDYPAYNSLSDNSFYKINEDSPAIPMYAGTYISVADLIVTDNDGNIFLGNELTYVNISGNSGITIDNSIGRITAYSKGTYEIKATHPSGKEMTLYAVVKNKGDATWDIYNIDFTEYDDEYTKLGYINNNKYSAQTPADVITYNGQPVSDTNPAPSAPAGWQSYYFHPKNPSEESTKCVSEFSQSVFPYTTCDGEPLGYLVDDNYVNTINSGIMPFGNPVDLGYNTFDTYQQSGYFVLNNSVVNAFTNLTITTNANLFSSITGGSEFGVVGRLNLDSNGSLQFSGTNPTPAFSVYLGGNCGGSHASNAPAEVLSVVRTDNIDTDGQRGLIKNNGKNNVKFFWDYLTNLKHCEDWNAPESRNGVNVSLSVKYEGDTATLSSPYDPAAETYVLDSPRGKGGIAFVQYGLTDWGIGSWTNLKTVKVSLNNMDGECPHYTEFDSFITKDNAYLYTNVGQEINMVDMVLEIDGIYYNGIDVTWDSSDNDKLVVNNTTKTITTTEKGTYTLTASVGGNSLKIMVAVKNADEDFFVNNNYQINIEKGNIVSYTVVDPSAPYSKQIEFTDRIYNANGTWTNIYEVAAGLSLNSSAYNTVVESVIFKGDNGKESYIESIGANAFQNAINLKNVELPSRLRTIGSNAFRNASALTEITIPAMVKTIGAGAFADCASLTDIYLYSPDVEIAPDAIPMTTTIHCLEGSDVESALIEAGYTTVPLDVARTTFATSERARIADLDAKRIETVDTGVLWIGQDCGEIYGNQLTGFCLNNRDAGKLIITPIFDFLDEMQGYVKLTDRKMSIIYSAFSNENDTRAILSIEVQEGIGNGLFDYCFNLQELVLPNDFQSIPMNAFKGCTSLRKVNIPDDARCLGKYIFADCSNPELEIIISEKSNLQYIGHNELGTDPAEPSFNNCGAKKIYIPITVEFISDEAFKSSSFVDITVAGKDTAFTNYRGAPFKEGESLPQFFADGTIIRGLKGSKAEEYVTAYNEQVGHEALIFTTKDADGNELKDFFVENIDKVDENSEFKAELTANGYYAITEYRGVGGKIIIPAIIAEAKDGTLNAPIYAASAGMFQNENNTKPSIVRVLKLEISEGISIIEAGAFKGAVNLTEVKFPLSLKEIGKQAFQKAGIKGIVEIPKNVQTIGANAFAACNDMTDIYIYNPKATISSGAIPKSVIIHGVKGSTAEDYATKNKMTFVEISAPNLETASDVSDNGNYSFVVEGSKIVGYNRTDASKPYSRKVVIPAKIGDVTITEISENIFDIPAEKTSVYALVISEGISVIGNNAALNCISLTHLELPKSITTIGDSAFEKTSLIGDIVLSEKVNTVGSRAFFGCRNIDSVTVLNKDCVLKPTSLPQGGDCKIIGYKDSTAETYAKDVKLNFVCLDPVTKDDTKEDTKTDENDDNKGDLIGPSDDDDDGKSGIIKVIRQSDLTLVIVIAVAVLFLVLLLGAALVLVVFLKKRQNSDL